MKQVSLIASIVTLIILTGAIAFNPLADTGPGVGASVQNEVTERTVIFDVDKMTCAACPISVRNAMEKVDGVRSVAVDFQAKTATVVFDPAMTTPEKIGQASTNAGYPATPDL